MKLHSTKNLNNRRAGERGAALVTMLLLSVLLLGAGGALVMSTMMSANNSIGTTPEMQAYYVAESGMQSALNVLRGNVQPLVTATDRISFRSAIIPDISNGPDNAGDLRLAGWLPYNDRKDPASLVPVNIGTFAGGYRITVENMDPDSHIVAFETSGIIEAGDAGASNQKTFGTAGGADEVIVRYTGQALTNLTPNPNNFPLTLDSALGSFVIERPLSSTQNGVVIPLTGFEITITQSLPWAATTTLEGTFAGVVNTNSTTMQVTFDKVSVKADGTTYALNVGGGAVLNLLYNASPTVTTIPARVTSPDPKRLRLRSYGFGPQGAEKRLELMVNKENFEFDTPAGVTIRGADDCSPLTLATGQSGSKVYSGVDAAGKEPQRPAFAVTPCDEAAATKGLEKPDTISDPKIGLLGDDDTTPGTVETPSFLDSANKARAYLNNLQSKAQTLNRYFNSGTTVNHSVNSPMFTFVDGDCTLTSGSGLLVVTGTLTMRGNTNFKGSIMVLGKGVVIRDGGGNSTVQYDSTALTNALGSGTNVSGIREF